MRYTPSKQIAACQRMLRERTCPPLELLERGGADIEAHLEGCSRCRALLDTSWAFEDIDGLFPACEPAPEEMVGHPGEIRSLKRSAAGGDLKDGDNCWRNPPVVLLLCKDARAEGMFKVAQLHDALELERDGDYPLDDDMPGFFAESWNTFSCFVDSMTPPLAVAPRKTVDAVLRASSRDIDWASTGSIVAGFRSSEMETGAFFGRKALDRARAELEKKRIFPPLPSCSQTDFKRMLRALPPRYASPAALERRISPSSLSGAAGSCGAGAGASGFSGTSAGASGHPAIIAGALGNSGAGLGLFPRPFFAGLLGAAVGVAAGFSKPFKSPQELSSGLWHGGKDERVEPETFSASIPLVFVSPCRGVTKTVGIDCSVERKQRGAGKLSVQVKGPARKFGGRFRAAVLIDRQGEKIELESVNEENGSFSLLFAMGVADWNERLDLVFLLEEPERASDLPSR